MANDNSTGNAVLAMVAILAIIAVSLFAIRLLQSPESEGDILTPPDVDIEIPGTDGGGTGGGPSY